MLDIHANPHPGRPPVRDVEFLRIELCPLAEGRVHMSVTATTIDDQGQHLTHIQRYRKHKQFVRVVLRCMLTDILRPRALF